jgi:hypothetical protein
MQKGKGKGKEIQFQALTDPEGSRMFRLPDLKIIVTRMWQGCQPYALAAFISQDLLLVLISVRGGALVEALRYKPEGRGIDSKRCYWNFSVT